MNPFLLRSASSGYYAFCSATGVHQQGSNPPGVTWFFFRSSGLKKFQVVSVLTEDQKGGKGTKKAAEELQATGNSTMEKFK